MSTPSFEERFGLPKKELQVGAIDRATRIRIWNELNIRLWDVIIDTHYEYKQPDRIVMTSLTKTYLYCLWSDVMKWDAINIPERKNILVNQFRVYLLNEKLSWIRFLEFVEKAVVIYLEIEEEYTNEENYACEDYIEAVNRVFIEEACGVRFIGTHLSPIVDEAEVTEINEALVKTESVTSVKRHLKRALSHLSDRNQPDYNNSVKESISSIEALCKLIVNKEDSSLTQILDEVGKKVQIHPKLKLSIKNLYDWSSDASGVRHANKGDESENFDSAKLILVLCSGIVNYLIVKCNEAGIVLKS